MDDKITKGGYVVDENGIARKTEDIQLADKVIELKNKENPWTVVDFLLGVWLKRTPEEAKMLKIQLEDQRENLTDKEFGTTKDGRDFDRRFTMVFPLTLMRMIRSVYDEKDLPMNSEFYREFVQKYPNFRIAEKT